MKKFLVIFTILSMLCGNAYGAAEWGKTHPDGSDYAADIDYYVADLNNEALDRLLSNYKNGCNVYYIAAGSVGVATGEVVCSNTAGTIRKFRKNTSALTLTWANIDAGAEASSTTYYVYAVADADATTFTGMISTSASAPTGATYYKKLGAFYNNSSGDIECGGKIIMWSGTTASIPSGWVLCDGNNGTPDLRDHFIFAAGNLSDPGDYKDNTAVYSLGGTGSAVTFSGSGGAGTGSGDSRLTYTSYDIIMPYYALAFIMEQGSE